MAATTAADIATIAVIHCGTFPQSKFMVGPYFCVIVAPHQARTAHTAFAIGNAGSPPLRIADVVSCRPSSARAEHAFVVAASRMVRANVFSFGRAAHGLLPNLCSAAASSAMFAFWRQISSMLRYNHASIARVSLLLVSTTCAVVATRADTC